MKEYRVRKKMTDEQAEKLKAKYVDESYIDELITSDADGFDSSGRLLFRFRKGVVPYETVRNGYESFKDSITVTESRGAAAGGSFKRVRADGSVSNTTVSYPATSGNVGYMDESALIRFCRLTQFGRDHFDKFEQGIPFVQHIDKLYAELCPEHYARQKGMALGTNPSYIIGDTAFTTVTVNKSFRTAVHQDSGDLPDGMGNLIVFNDGSYDGGYFVLPQFGIGLDVQTGDALFVDVHQWHGNTEMKLRPGFDEVFRISFVLYYRQGMIKCKAPSVQLKEAKIKFGGYYTL